MILVYMRLFIPQLSVLMSWRRRPIAAPYIDKAPIIPFLYSGKQTYRNFEAVQIMKAQVGPFGKALNYHVTQNKLLFPVPVNEIQLVGNLTQNPGY